MKARHPLLGYGCAVLSVAVVTLLRLLLQPLVGRSYAFALSYLAIFFTARYGGLGPAVLATILGGLVGNLVFLFSSSAPLSTRFTSFGFYALTAMTGSVLIVKERKAYRRAAENARLAQLRFEHLEEEIQERRRTEALLRRTQANLAQSQRMAHLGSWESDLATNELWWSEETYRIFGLAPDQQISRALFFDLVHPDDKASVQEASEHAQIRNKPYRIEHRIIRPDGSVRYVQEQAEVITDQDGKAIRMLGTVQDITEYKVLEEQFRQAQKMEAVGQLAGGIAHDFNNLLTVINGYGQVLLESFEPEDPNREMVEEVVKAGVRAAALTKQLLAFSRRQVLELRVINVNSVVSGIESMLRRLIGENIRLRSKLDPRVGNIKADPGQLEQVIVNLVVNARDAMPNGGTLTIETANVDLDEAYAAEHAAVQPGPYAVLIVSDTGTGMDAQTQARIFEPFFTTKGLGRGTGLGLATVYGIVKQSGGYIWVYSEPGHGTTFKIYLPRLSDEVLLPAASAAPSESLAGGETILVVEDDASIRGLIQNLLSRQGYTVLVVGGAQEALETCQTLQGSIDLLLTDVVMPDMGGPELASQLLELRPEMRVVYMSGYTENTISQHGVLNQEITLLEKPFTAESLVRKVREVLGPRQHVPDHADALSDAPGPQ